MLRRRPDVVKQLRHDLQYPEGACGIAVVMNGKTIGIDLFDKPDSLQKVWDRLVVLGLTLDARAVRGHDRHADGITKAVRVYMESDRKLRWHQESTVGWARCAVRPATTAGWRLRLSWTACRSTSA